VVRFFIFLPLFVASCAGKTPLRVLPETSILHGPELGQSAVQPESPVLLHAKGLGPWRLGMSRFDVLQAGDCERFTPVRVTGGFECLSWDSPLGVRRVSFVFDAAYRLEKIQMWLFDGSVESEQPEAQKRTDWARESFQAIATVRMHHQLTSTVNPTFLQMDESEFVQALQIGSADGMPFSLNFKVQGDPAATTRQWLSVIASPQGAYSFLFAAR
jgi:hypothetical protein